MAAVPICSDFGAPQNKVSHCFPIYLPWSDAMILVFWMLSFKPTFSPSSLTFIKRLFSFSSLQFSCSVMSDFLRPHGLQHAKPPCPSPTPRVYPNSCPLSQWCHPAISSFVVPFSSCPQSLPASVFSNKSTFRMKWPKYWSFSFSISPSKEQPGLISFRMDWLDLLAVQGTLKSLLH